MLRFLRVQRRWLYGLGLLGGGLTASSGFRAGGFGAGTIRRSRGSLSRCLLLFLFLVVQNLLRRVTTDRDTKYGAKVFLRQSIELEET
jgi:hypothetical protein